jgi:2-amino-1-hydroxyethylphosphonate dioxygenase (glycine-forming)
MHPQETAAYLISLYHAYGDADYIGEPVSQLEHMVQCAELAEASGADEENILAAFLHDIGHFCEHIVPGEVQYMDGFGIVDHEKLGAGFLRQHGFSEKICALVASHVPAKRYLTFADENYFQQLSAASRQTLEFQGGRMSAAEAALFEAEPLFAQYIQLRRWDEQAKATGRPVPPLAHCEAMIVRHLENAF